MAEYTKGVLAAGAPIGTPAFGSRKDKPADLAGADVSLAPLRLNSAGELAVCYEGGRTTFSGAMKGLLSPASCTNLFTLGGSASAIVKITRLKISFTGTAKTVDVSLIKQSAADTGGTPVPMTLVPHDAGNAPVAIPGDVIAQGYTAVPTVGTLVGALRQEKYTCAAADAASAGPPPIDWDFNRNGEQPIVLRGIAQQIAINLNTTTITNGNFDIWVEGIIEPATA